MIKIDKFWLILKWLILFEESTLQSQKDFKRSTNFDRFHSWLVRVNKNLTLLTNMDYSWVMETEFRRKCPMTEEREIKRERDDQRMAKAFNPISPEWNSSFLTLSIKDSLSLSLSLDSEKRGWVVDVSRLSKTGDRPEALPETSCSLHVLISILLRLSRFAFSAPSPDHPRDEEGPGQSKNIPFLSSSKNGLFPIISNPEYSQFILESIGNDWKRLERTESIQINYYFWIGRDRNIFGWTWSFRITFNEDRNLNSF